MKVERHLHVLCSTQSHKRARAAATEKDVVQGHGMLCMDRHPPRQAVGTTTGQARRIR